MLAHRLRSGALAGFSGRHELLAAPRPQLQRREPMTAPRALQETGSDSLPRPNPFLINPGFFSAGSLHNREPNYNDPDWFEQVTDWDEFWNHTRWDLETASDSVDVAGNRTRTIARVEQLRQAIRQVEARPDVMNMVPTIVERDHSDPWLDPPEEPEVQEELPAWDVNDWRAFSEKQRFKDLMDLEWRRRQDKVGRIPYPHKDPRHDARYQRFDDPDWDWEHDDVYRLITMDGAACRPEDHKAAVENPLVVVDMPNVQGVYYIEETDEFIERIGHMHEPAAMEFLDHSVVMNIQDVDLPAEVLEAALLPQARIMDRMAAEEEWRAEEGTWLGDAL